MARLLWPAALLPQRPALRLARGVGLALRLAAALLLLVGNACTLSLERGGGDQTLRILGAEIDTLDPALAQDRATADYAVEIFSGLVALSPKMEVVPDLAEKWQVSPDGRTYTFILRKNVRFHDGRPMKAADVKYSLERAADPRTRSPVAALYLGDIVGVSERLAGKASEISGVRVKDDYTIELVIDQPKAYFLSKLTYPAAFVVDRANVESGPDWVRRPNGTGPFKLREWRPEERIILARHDAYYGEKPRLAQIEISLDPAGAMGRYEAGGLDIVPVGLNDLERVTDKSQPLNKELRVSSELSVHYLGFNLLTKPFDDVKVRQAFNYALDKDKLINVVLKKMHVKANGVLPPGMAGYNDKLRPLSFDVTRARQLIAESSYRDVKNFPEIILHTYGSTGLPNRYIQAIVDMYKQNLGVEIKIMQADWPTFLEDIVRGKDRYQMFTLGWVADYPDPENFLDLLFHSQSQNNHVNYANPEVDRLLERARTERDPAARWRLYQQVEQRLVDDAVWVPLWHPRNYELVKPYVKGYLAVPVVISRYKDVSLTGRPPAPQPPRQSGA